MKSKKVKTKAMALAICVVLLVGLGGVVSATADIDYSTGEPQTQDMISPTSVPAPSVATPGKVIQSFDGTRTYLNYYLTGSYMTTAKDLLIENGFTIKSTNKITSESLAGVDIFCTGMLDSSLSTDEQNVLKDFVTNGGTLVFTGDNSYFDTWSNSCTGIFGIMLSGDGPDTVTVTDTTHPITNGKYGTVTTLSMNSPGQITAYPAVAKNLAAVDSKSALIAIEPGTTYTGNGKAAFFVDVNMFAGTIDSNSVLWQNAFEWAAGGPAPEPTISIYTDTYSYTAGDTMRVGLDVTNPGAARDVRFALWLELPTGGPYVHINTLVTLPAGMPDYSNPDFVVIPTLPSLTTGTYIWNAALIEPSGPIVFISRDMTSWDFVPAVAGAPTEDIARTLEQIAVAIDFDE